MSSAPVGVPVLSSGVPVPDLAYADDITLMASTPQGLQRLIDLVCEFCALIGMVLACPKPKSSFSTLLFLGHCNGLVGVSNLKFVSEFKYLRFIFSALYGMATAFPKLKKNMFAAWALLKRQYGHL